MQRTAPTSRGLPSRGHERQLFLNSRRTALWHKYGSQRSTYVR